MLRQIINPSLQIRYASKRDRDSVEKRVASLFHEVAVVKEKKEIQRVKLRKDDTQPNLGTFLTDAESALFALFWSSHTQDQERLRFAIENPLAHVF